MCELGALRPTISDRSAGVSRCDPYGSGRRGRGGTRGPRVFARSPSEPWIAIAETVVPSERSSSAQGAPRRRCTRDHLGPLVVPGAVAVDHRQPARRAATRRAHQGVARPRARAARAATSVTRWNGVNSARMSGAEARTTPTTQTTQQQRRRRRSRRAARRAAARCAAARHAAAQSRQAWMSVSRMPRAPRSYSSSISRWAPSRGHHRAHRDPALAMQRRDRRALDARGQRDGLVDLLVGDVVVHHHVAAGHQDALEPAPEDLEARPAVVAAAGDQHRLGLQDRLAEDLQPGLAQGAAGLDDVGDHVGDAELDAGLDGAVEPDHGRRRCRARRGNCAHHADVRRGDPLARRGRRASVSVPGRAGEAEP